MKRERQNRILELIESREIATQEPWNRPGPPPP
jgi:arginine repressor